MSTPTITSAIDNLASAIWNNDVIHDRICETADSDTLALIARLDRRSFQVSSKWLWREGGDEGQIEYHLASVTCPDRYTAYTSAVRTLALVDTPLYGIPKHLSLYPNLVRISISRSFINIKILRNPNHQIKLVQCILPDLDGVQGKDVQLGHIQNAKRLVPSHLPIEVILWGVWIKDMLDTRAVHELAHQYPYVAFDELYIADDLFILPDSCQEVRELAIALRSTSTSVQLTLGEDMSGNIKEHVDYHARHVVDQAIDIFTSRRIKVITGHTDTLCNVLHLMTDYRDTIRATTDFAIRIQYPTVFDIQSLHQLRHTLPSYASAHPREWPTQPMYITFTIVETYDPRHQPEIRLGRFFRDVAWLDALAEICLHIGGPFVHYGLCYAAEAGQVSDDASTWQSPLKPVADMDERNRKHAWVSDQVGRSLSDAFHERVAVAIEARRQKEAVGWTRRGAADLITGELAGLHFAADTDNDFIR